MTGSDGTDPRLETRYVATVPPTDDAGRVTLVGVVHDHPASAYRVRSVVRAAAPAVVALELPPVAVPLYEAYAAESGSAPDRGGELSAAVAAAPDADVAGVDGPSIGFVATLARRLARERASLRTAARSAASVLSVTRTALACRVAATVNTRTPGSLEVGSPTPHEVTRADPAAEQAADERRQIRAATAVMDALETAPSTRYRAESRECHMAERIGTLRDQGDVVAVVGAGHFDPLCERLDADRDVPVPGAVHADQGV